MVLSFQFKEINRAHGVLSDEAKKDIYDKYGSRGLQLLDQMGPDVSIFHTFLLEVTIKTLLKPVYCVA